MTDSDLKTIAFGYYVLGFMRSAEGLNGELPPDGARDWLRDEFEKEWQDTAETGRRLLADPEAEA